MSLVEEIKKYARKRGRELRDLAGADLTVDTVEASVAGQRVKFRANVERQAAWKLYVELNTRVATQSLARGEGLLREALSSLHAIFGVTREILKEAGPAVAQSEESLGRYAMAVLNRSLRPLLSRWHPRLADWEQRRPAEVSRPDHETQWPQAEAMRQDLERVAVVLRGYCEALAILAGIEAVVGEELSQSATEDPG